MNLPFSPHILVYALIIVAGLTLINLIWLVFLANKIKTLLGGTNAKDIQEGLSIIRSEINKLKAFRTEIEKYLETVEFRLKRSVQSVESIRFNPFKGTGSGGNQSFSTAFIDENGDGVVVSGLYSRDRVSVFSKAVKGYTSTFELTEEETEVIENSKKKISSRE
ncbi:MAG TPA: DUF4446 family protein [Candidatus Nanoarchaeia archaeon]|nr:DUF4446 family protein [Candidatus Nanoarchaeia archaeon]